MGDAVAHLEADGGIVDSRKGVERTVGVLYPILAVEAVLAEVDVAIVDAAVYPDPVFVVEIYFTVARMPDASVQRQHVFVETDAPHPKAVVVIGDGGALGSAEVQRECDGAARPGCIGAEGEVLLIKMVEPVAPQTAQDAVALIAEEGCAERYALVQQGVETVAQDGFAQGVVVEIITYSLDIVAFAGVHPVVDRGFPSLDDGVGAHLGMQVAPALEGRGEGGRGLLHQQGVVTDGGFAEAAHEAVPPSRAVAPGQVVDGQRHLGKAEPLGIGLLPDIRAIVGGLDVRIVTGQPDTLQQQLVRGQMLRGGATRHEEQPQRPPHHCAQTDSPPRCTRETGNGRCRRHHTERLRRDHGFFCEGKGGQDVPPWESIFAEEKTVMRGD